MKRVSGLLMALMMLMSASPCSAQESTPLWALCEKHGFKLGAAMSFGNLRTAKYTDILKQNFNSITATNEMKAYSLLHQADSEKDPNGMPAMRFDAADAMVKFAMENGIAVRGHVLTWDAYMTDWFFRENYRPRGEYVDSETMKARLRHYIIEVVTHFETKFPGVVYCWDVVNEAVGDNAAEWKVGDARHLRTKRNGEGNIFYDRIGPDYVELAFQYAREAVDMLGADIKLFYNDYNAFSPSKRNAIIKLVESINSYSDKKLLDGVGMQGYIGGYGTQSGCMNDYDIELIKSAIEKYAALGIEVHITEMSVRTYVNDEATMQTHCEYYAKLFKAFKEVNAGDAKPLTSVSIWGLTDCNSLPKTNYSYLLNSPYCGLYTEDLSPKPELEYVRAELMKD